MDTNTHSLIKRYRFSGFIFIIAAIVVLCVLWSKTEQVRHITLEAAQTLESSDTLSESDRLKIADMLKDYAPLFPWLVRGWAVAIMAIGMLFLIFQQEAKKINRNNPS